jgi:hypothetical protein
MFIAGPELLSGTLSARRRRGAGDPVQPRLRRDERPQDAHPGGESYRRIQNHRGLAGTWQHILEISA